MYLFTAASRFMKFLLGYVHKRNIEIFWTISDLSFRVFRNCWYFFVHPSFLSFSYLFAAVAGLLQDLLPIQEVSTIETGNSYHGVVKSRWCKFCFLGMFLAQLTQSHWSGYHCKDRFLMHNLRVSDMMPILARPAQAHMGWSINKGSGQNYYTRTHQTTK